jgi:hypothetical protein
VVNSDGVATLIDAWSRALDGARRRGQDGRLQAACGGKAHADLRPER